jgi:predicted nuclease of predicted toxin-antitoxin system
MRFVVDECTGSLVAQWLRNEGHDAVSIYDEARGSSDLSVLSRAVREDRILITNDKDFGQRVFQDHLPHKGIILLRLEDPRSTNKIAV